MTSNPLGINKAIKDTKVCVAMSGGVDSSAAAYLLKKQGFQVIGITMDLLQEPYCPKQSSIKDAAIVAKHLKIEHHFFDLKEEFKSKVVDYFVDSYLDGLTPSPCIICNKHIKLGILAQKARELGADILVTGHYAEVRVTDNGTELHRAKDLKKDQSYFLFAISKEDLNILRCPLTNFYKDQTRALAKEAGLSIHDKSDSQDICFVTEGKYAELIEKMRPNYKSSSGNIITTDGRILGSHKGIIHYTVGQRRGLGIGGDAGILYVLRIDSQNNQIIVGPQKELKQQIVKIKDINWLAKEKPQEMILDVKLRSRQNLVKASVKFFDNNTAELLLLEDFYGVASGQGCCFYQGTRVMGGGIIE